MNFNVVPKGTYLKDQGPPYTAYLKEDNWDDFGFRTFFVLSVYDEQAKLHEIGAVRIGFKGQESGNTSNHMERNFSTLNENFFSLGHGVEYYTYFMENLSKELRGSVLNALRDVAYNTKILSMANQEKVMGTSLLRDTGLSVVTSQYVRILRGEATLTAYNFSYQKSKSGKYSGIKVDFEVEPESTPPTNIHILIGRNGVGKTTLLNNMVNAVLSTDKNKEETGFFSDNDRSWFSKVMNPETPALLGSDYFSGVVSVSFSAFDPFVPPQEQADPTKGICYYYVGLKDLNAKEGRHKETKELCQDFISSVDSCLQIKPKKELWLNAIKTLESDGNFAELNLASLANEATDERFILKDAAYAIFEKMSSGHAIVLLTITKLIEKVEEKTLILIDEPESHLHPPLLAAFIRAISDLLLKRNGIAIIATHSPVVLQEVPKSCVSILRRTGLEMRVERPERETFAENVGTLTHEVFRLEVTKSGFHALLAKSAESEKNLDEIIEEYGGQIGFEGKALLQSLINSKKQQ
ncbi:MAG: AAA family ATPase [Alphaproteobacteria bacterium]|nr:AAA family ATPase [Alphaproteobacteria bacterium]